MIIQKYIYFFLKNMAEDIKKYFNLRNAVLPVSTILWILWLLIWWVWTVSRWTYTSKTNSEKIDIIQSQQLTREDARTIFKDVIDDSLEDQTNKLIVLFDDRYLKKND